MRDLYARIVLWLIRPALERNERVRAQQSARISEAVLQSAVKAMKSRAKPEQEGLDKLVREVVLSDLCRNGPIAAAIRCCQDGSGRLPGSERG